MVELWAMGMTKFMRQTALVGTVLYLLAKEVSALSTSKPPPPPRPPLLSLFPPPSSPVLQAAGFSIYLCSPFLPRGCSGAWPWLRGCVGCVGALALSRCAHANIRAHTRALRAPTHHLLGRRTMTTGCVRLRGVRLVDLEIRLAHTRLVDHACTHRILCQEAARV